MKEVKIKKGVPIPERTRGAPLKYPYRTMEVGDSFNAENAASVRAAISRYSRQTGRKFCSQRQKDGTYSFWRIA